MPVETAIWLAVVSALLTMNAGLFAIAYRDVSRRMEKLEKQDAKLNAAILTLLVAKADDHDAIASALHGLLINGVAHD